jgi:F-box-like
MQTPFADKLHTNYIPIVPEIDLIHQVILKPLDDISQLDPKIARLKAILDDLSQERDELSRFVQDHRALLSGARRLPQDIVLEIFLHCLPNDRNAVMSSDEAPVLLGRICRSWRQISLSTPRLWSSLHIPIPDPSFLIRHGREKLFQRGAVVKAWLELSGSCPLSLSVISDSRVDAREDEETCFAAKHLLYTIVEFSERWKDVDFIVPLPVYNECLSTLEKADVPVLEKIRFRCKTRDAFGRPVDDGFGWYPAPMFRTPSLRYVALRSVDYTNLSTDHTTSRFALCWKSLTHLSLALDRGRSQISSMKALDILNQCSKLVSCKMVIDFGDEDQISPRRNITLPFLHSLEITVGRNMAKGNFFDALSLPSLQHFMYSGHLLSERNASVPFKSIMRQAQTPGIESFDLDMATISRSGLVLECLPNLPSLKRLNLFKASRHHISPGLDDFPALLTPAAGSRECLSPCLEEIRIEQCSKISDDAIVRFLKARTNTDLYPNIARLKRAKFSLERQRTKDILPELMPLMMEGLQVHLDYYPPADSREDSCSPRSGLQPRDYASMWRT